MQDAVAVRRPSLPLLLLAALTLAAAGLGCAGSKKPETAPDASAAPPAPVVPPPAANHQVGPSGPQLPIIAPPAKSFAKAKKGYVPMCESGGVIKDDGQLETGYGYVPSATTGIYLQEYSADEFANRALDHVCVCWLHKRTDTAIDFEVVFYEKKEGKPAEEPYATRPGHAEEVPLGKESGGLFYDVDVSGVELVPGTSYIGIRWNPSVDPFFFICADHGPEGAVTAGFQRDDRAPNWLSILGSPDPIFTKHKAMMLRVVAKPESAKADQGGAGKEKIEYNKSIKKKPAKTPPPAPAAPAAQAEDEKKTPPV